MKDIGAAVLGDSFCKLKMKNDRLVQCFFWALFKSDRGMLVDHTQIDEIIVGEKEANLPIFPVKIFHPDGWIDEYLNYLSFLILKLIGSV